MLRGYVLKVSPDEDRYLVWSDNVEAPTCLGGRAEILALMATNPGESAEARMARVDRTGTSACWPTPEDPIYGFDDTGMIYEQRGWLPRSRLGLAYDAWLRADEEAVWDLLEPFDSETPVRRG